MLGLLIAPAPVGEGEGFFLSSVGEALLAVGVLSPELDPDPDPDPDAEAVAELDPEAEPLPLSEVLILGATRREYVLVALLPWVGVTPPEISEVAVTEPEVMVPEPEPELEPDPDAGL